jgi:hypothetical protein
MVTCPPKHTIQIDIDMSLRGPKIGGKRRQGVKCYGTSDLLPFDGTFIWYCPFQQKRSVTPSCSESRKRAAKRSGNHGPASPAHREALFLSRSVGWARLFVPTMTNMPFEWANFGQHSVSVGRKQHLPTLQKTTLGKVIFEMSFYGRIFLQHRVG